MGFSDGEVYPLGRNPDESSRLDFQHTLYLKVTGACLHKSIPKETLTKIADVGTGTGIWLADVSATLGVPHLSLHGYDISGEQFPASRDHLHFSVQDILKPFPQEDLGQYDLVNVRFLVGALRETEYRSAVTNIVGLLKPGGYVQWSEVDFDFSFQNKACEMAGVAEILKVFFEYIRQFQLSQCASNTIQTACMSVGLEGVQVTRYNTNDISQSSESTETVRRWFTDLFSAMLPAMYLRLGQAYDDSSASLKALEALRQADTVFNQGLLPDETFGVVIGRKPFVTSADQGS